MYPAPWRNVPGLMAGTLFLALASVPAPINAAQSGTVESFDDSAIVSAKHPAWFKQSFLDLPDDLSDALKQGKKGLMVYFSTEGCAYCKVFVEKSLGDPAIAATVRKHFETVNLEIFEDAEMTDLQGKAMAVKAFAKRERAEFSPTVIFYGADGKSLLRVVGYQSPERFKLVLNYVIGDHYKTATLHDYLAAHAAPPSPGKKAARLIDNPLFLTPPYVLDRRIPAKYPLLVIFEQPGCDECMQFHKKILTDPNVQPLLKQFEVVRLDSTDSKTAVLGTRGEKLTPKRWADSLGLTHSPALVFFDEAGKEVLRIDALVLNQRMARALGYVLDKAYLQDIQYQRYTREKSLERLRAVK
jgi:thioredoxin-related protein